MRYIRRRVLIAVPTALGAASVSFLLMRVIPGDPARMIAGPNADFEDIQRLREQLGLTRPVWEQYIEFMLGLLRGDMGTSARTGQPVLAEIAARVPRTLELTVLALIVATVIGLTLGIIAAINRNRAPDLVASTVSVIGISMPAYWSGLLFIIFFSVNLGWLPVGGADTWQHRVLPTLTLSLFALGFISRQTRASMVETMEMDFIRTMRAKGLSEATVIWRHGLRNAALPILTIIGLQFGALIGGAVLTETIFAWPGLGRLIVQSIESRDFPVVQGAIFIFAVALIIINLVTDLLYAYIDPRIRYG